MTATTPNRLGYCEQCRGSLCTKGDTICCAVCGLPVPNHPLAAKAAPPPPAANAPVAVIAELDAPPARPAGASRKR